LVVIVLQYCSILYSRLLFFIIYYNVIEIIIAQFIEKRL